MILVTEPFAIGRTLASTFEIGNAMICAPMSYFVNRIGQRYGRLMVLQQVTKHAPIKWECRCDCGKILIAIGKSMVEGATNSCGCLRAERISRSKTKHGHSLRATPEYRAWTHLRQRCTNPNEEYYANYGGRGITFCDRWRESFNNFLADMGPRPSRKHSIDRIDPNGNYEPGNCRWATPVQQANNTRRNIRLSFNGENKTVSEWARVIHLHASTIHTRISLGWPVDRILQEPVNWYRKPWRSNRTGYA